MSDDPGVMGNLPRSRPGRRSSKRDGGAKPEVSPTGGVKPAAKAKPARGKSAAGRTSARKTSVSKPSPAPSRTRARAAESPQTPPREQPAARTEAAPQGGTDPITGAVLLAGKVVEGGLKVARGIIKRLPKP
jgi:hypothetical protein